MAAPRKHDDTPEEEVSAAAEEPTSAELAAQTATPDDSKGGAWQILHDGVGPYLKGEIVPTDAWDGREAQRLVNLGAIIGTFAAPTRDVASPPPPLVKVMPVDQ